MQIKEFRRLAVLIAAAMQHYRNMTPLVDLTLEKGADAFRTRRRTAHLVPGGGRLDDRGRRIHIPAQ
jgi:hypothetical protein